MSLDILKKDIKNKKFSSLYLLWGDEGFLRDFYFNKLKELNCEDFKEFNQVVFNGDSLDLNELFQTVSAYPFMSEKKFVGIYNFDTSKLKDDYIKKLSEILSSIADGVCVVITDNKLYDKKKQSPLKKIIEKLGGVCVFLAKPSEAQLVNWVKRHLKNIDNECASFLISYAGTDMQNLLNETNKLKFYSNGENITKKMIEKVATKSQNATNFELSDAISAKNYDRVLSIIDELYVQNYADMQIANIFYKTFTDLYIAKCALDCGKNAELLSSDLGYHPYVAQKIIKSAYRLDIDFLKNALIKCVEFDKKVKSQTVNFKNEIIFLLGEIISWKK